MIIIVLYYNYRFFKIDLLIFYQTLPQIGIVVFLLYFAFTQWATDMIVINHRKKTND